MMYRNSKFEHNFDRNAAGWEASMESRNPIIRKAEQEYQEGGPGFAAVTPTGAANQAAGAHSAGSPGTAPSGTPATAEQLQQMYAAPAVAGAAGTAMTLTDVVMKSAITFGVILVGSVFGWFTAESLPFVWIGAALVAFAIAMVNIFKKQISPALVLGYALFEGVFLGGISFWYQQIGEQNGYGNLVLTAVIATFVVFATMLTLYTKRIIRVTNKFKKILFISMISYLGLAVISLIAGLFGVGDGWGFFGVGPLGLVFSGLVVVLAAFVLTLDFDAIEQGIQYGVPERESWRMAFGLMVTLVWLYLEILRFLAIFTRN